jgi:precorrin-2 dehydrogenase/sirohydrochlorin ferrochelatase
VTPYYPLCLDLRGRPCVVIGGGAVAARKVAGLLECGARVTVVAPSLGPALAELYGAGAVEARLRPYQDGDLAGAVLAIAATDDAAVNGQVAAEAQARGVLLNVVDDPARGDFIVPAVLRRGALQLAVSTGGLSPALARWVRDALEGLVPAEYADLLPVLAELRAELRRAGVEVPAERWQSAVDAEVLASLRAGDGPAARERLRDRLTPVTVATSQSPMEA